MNYLFYFLTKLLYTELRFPETIVSFDDIANRK